MTIITAQYLRADGSPESGWVSFQLVPAALDANSDQRTGTEITVELAWDGSLEVDLVPDSDLVGLTGDAVYVVREKVGSMNRSWHLLVPDATPIDLNTAYPGTEQEWTGVVLPGGGGGAGVPAGGTTGQVLAKVDDTDYNTEWATPAEGGGVLHPVATSGSYDDLADKPVLGTAADNAETDFATAAQGALADSAVQPDDLSGYAPAAHTHPATDISDSTAVGRSVVTAADAAAARTAIGAGTSDFDGAYGSLTGQPTLGSAAATEASDYATAAQGALAATSVQQDGSGSITSITAVTQATYDALTPPDANTLYVITGP